MTIFADQLAAKMNEIMESSEHKSIFGTSPIGKFAAKKDDKEDDKKKDEKDDKKEDKKEDKKDKKDDKKKDKKAEVSALIQLFARGGALLDDCDLVKSSLAAINLLKVIAAEMKEKAEDKHDKKEDKKEDKEEKDDKDEKKDKDDDKSKADDSSYGDDFLPSESPFPTYDHEKQLEDMKKLDKLNLGKVPAESDGNKTLSDGNKALDAEKMFEDIPVMDVESKPVELDALTVPEIGSDELMSLLEAAGIKLTPEQEGKLSDMLEGGMKAEAMKIVGKLLASKFGA